MTPVPCVDFLLPICLPVSLDAVMPAPGSPLISGSVSCLPLILQSVDHVSMLHAVTPAWVLSLGFSGHTGYYSLFFSNVPNVPLVMLDAAMSVWIVFF